MARRRSERGFVRRTIDGEQIFQLLWAAQGTTGRGLRAAPSSGALYPLEIYLGLEIGQKTAIVLEIGLNNPLILLALAEFTCHCQVVLFDVIGGLAT